MRFPGWLIPAGCVALCANGALLGTALFLSHEEIVQKQDITAPVGINMLGEMAPDEPEEQQQVAEPAKPKEEPRPDLGPDLFEAEFAPELAAMGGASDAVSINLGGVTQGISKEKFVFETYELDQSPRPVVKTPPVYPYKAREQHVEGVVQVKILVREDGSVGEVLILDSRPKDVFDDAVLAAVPRWRFEPGKVGGKAVTSWVVTALHFKLNS
jgi:periplasmic protein TonB